MRPVCLFLIAFALGAAGASPARAQAPSPGAQVVRLLHWPPALYDQAPADPSEEPLYPFDLLPSIDTLSLAYAYRAEPGGPRLHFGLAWHPGPFGVYEDRPVAYEDLPGDVRLVAVDLRAQVYVDGRPVAALEIPLDSLALAPSPEVFTFSWDDASWEGVFPGTPADSARAFFEAGFELRGLEILRVTFASYASEDGLAYDPRRPAQVGVYPPRVGVWVDWLIWPDRDGGGKVDEGDAKPRGRTVGRGDGGTEAGPRSGGGRDGDAPAGVDRPERRADRPAGTAETTARTREKKRPKDPERTKATGEDDDEDDEDDEESLLPVALGAAAAVGALAVLGGTVGYYGNAEAAPFGLSAGFVRAGGGLLAQAAVNDAVLEKGDDETLIVKLTGFYNVLRLPVQPALGVGVHAVEGAGAVEISPTLSLGFVSGLGPLVLSGAYDLHTEGIELGVGFNFRSYRGGGR